MKNLFLSTLTLLLLSACIQDDRPGGGPNVEPPVGGLELTSLATQDGSQQLTFYNVATINVRAAREMLPLSALRLRRYAVSTTRRTARFTVWECCKRVMRRRGARSTPSTL